MLVKILGVFIIAGIYSALSLFVENLIKKTISCKGELKMYNVIFSLLCVLGAIVMTFVFLHAFIVIRNLLEEI